MHGPDVGEIFHERYALRERLGDGGTASVFRADDLELGRPVAIKVYGPESALSDDDRRRSEARALARLRHPAIVTLFDARLDATPPYLVLEYVDGETLAQRLTRGPMSVTETRLIGAAAASGLAAAHRAGIVHRDVKPANLVIPREPDPAEARLLDFGIAYSLHGPRSTTAGSFVGSAVYLSPEQATGEEVTAASDVYSLGLVLLECLTGRPAFEGTTAEVLAARLARAPSVDHPGLAGHGPLLARMTSPEPADRPSAAEVARELDGPAETRVLPATRAAETTQRLSLAPEATRTSRSPARRPVPPRLVAVVAGAIGIALALGIAATVLLAGLPGSPPAVPTGTPTDQAVVTAPPEDTAPADPKETGPGNSGTHGNNGNGNDKKP